MISCLERMYPVNLMMKMCQVVIRQCEGYKQQKPEVMDYYQLSHDVASGSDITLCNKICKPLVVYRFTGIVMTSITTLRT